MTYEEALNLPLLPMGNVTIGSATREQREAAAKFRREEAVRIEAMDLEEFMADREHYDALTAISTSSRRRWK